MSTEGDGKGPDDIPQFLKDLAEGARRMREAAEPTLRRFNEDVQRVVDAAADDLQRAVDAAAEQGARWSQSQAPSAPAPTEAPPAAPTAGDRYAALLRLRAWLDEHGPLAAVGASTMRAQGDRAHVGNWLDLDDDAWTRTLAAVRADAGVPLAWVAPTHVVRALLHAADDEARDAALEAAARDLSSAGRSVLTSVTLHQLDDLRTTLEEAWTAFDAGLPRPAIAAAGPALGELLAHRLDASFDDVRASMDAQRTAQPEAWPVAAVRMRAVWGAAATQARTRPAELDGLDLRRAPLGVEQEPVRAADALRVLVLATAAARELQFTLAEEWRAAS